MAWWYLLGAGVAEIGMAYALDASQGWSQAWPSVLGVALALVSIFLLARALQGLPLGTAYALWTGIGSVGVVLVGIVLLGERADALRLACIALVIAGSVGLRLHASPA